MSLSEITISFLAQFPAGEAADLTRKEARIEQFGNFAFGGLAVALFAGVCALVFIIITRMVLSGANPLAGIILGMFVAFAFLTLAYVFMQEHLKEKKNKLLRSAPDRSVAGASANALPSTHPEPAGSVVEDSTRLIPVDGRTRKLS